MTNKKLVYNIENGKIKESTNSYYNDIASEINIDNVLTASIPSLSNGILCSNNKILSSSSPQNNQILQWDNIAGSWLFKSNVVDDGTIDIPIQSAISGTILNNISVKTLEGVNSGILSVYNGGTGMTSADFPIDQECLLIADGSNKFKLFKKDEALKIGTRPYVLAPLTASSATDSSYNNNTITKFNGTFVTNAPTTPFGDTNALSCSYNGTAADYAGGASTVLNALVTSPPITGDFTVELWAYLANNGTHTDPNVRCGILGIRRNTSGVNTFEVFINNSGQFVLWVGANPGLITTSSPTLTNTINTWQHICLVRKGAYLTLYVNGLKASQVAFDPACTSDQYIYDFIGSVQWGNSINGYVTEYSRVAYAKTDVEIARYYNNAMKGLQGRRNRDYTSLTDDKLYKPTILAPFTGSSTTDISNNNNLIQTPFASIVSAPAGSPFGSISALSSSYNATAANYSARIAYPYAYSGDFTAEGWINLANVGRSTDTNFQSIILANNTNTYGLGLSGATNATSGFFSIWGGWTGVFAYYTITNLQFSANTWYHVALVKKGKYLTAYVNGISSVNLYTNILSTSTHLQVGNNSDGNWNINGFISEVSMVQYAKSTSEISTYYNAVLAGNQGRYTKDSTYLIEPAKTRSAAIIANPQGNGWITTPIDDDTYLDTSIFNYY